MESAPPRSTGSPDAGADLDAVRRIVLGGLGGLRARVFLDLAKRIFGDLSDYASLIGRWIDALEHRLPGGLHDAKDL